MYNNTALVIGPTGAGKSTLMNYIAGKELYFRIHNGRPGLVQNDQDAIAYVGRGEGSTTLAPNIWQSNTDDFQNITFMNCAGEFDSARVIIEVINSKIKSILARNITTAKILIVSSQDSITSSGAYGVLFKEVFEKSAQFLKDVNYFQDSMALIISHAGRLANTSNTINAYLRNVIGNPRLEKYKDTLENIVNNNRIAILSKYSDESD